MGALRRAQKIWAAVIAAVGLLVTAGCAGIGGLTMMVQDAAGTTRFDATRQSPQEQFERFGERYARVQELMTEAQLQVSRDTWRWNGEALAPWPEATAPNALPGANGDNSYYLVAGRSIAIEGATGAREDAEPMMAYFQSKGWQSRLDEFYGDYHVHADTGEGYTLTYKVRSNGHYSIDVISDLFWGDFHDLLHATADRIPDEAILTESVPGVFVPFPQWSDPIVARN